jgi:hypothetical protein
MEYQFDPNNLICFWKKLTGGEIRAYFKTNRGIESRTYSIKEIVDAIFNQKKLFFYSVDQIVRLLEEQCQIAA